LTSAILYVIIYKNLFQEVAMMPDVVYFTTDDIMKKYQVKRATIKKWRDEGMPYYKIGRGVRFKEDEVEKWIMDNKNTRD